MTKHPLADSYVEAKYFGPLMTPPPKLLVIHTAETPEMGTSAESVARYFASGPPSKASTTWVVDNNSIVQCVPLGHVNYAAPGANHNGEHMELAGRAAQIAQQWADPYSLAELGLAAKLFGVRAKELNIPVTFLRAADLLALKTPTGVTTHAEVTKAYKRSTHTDPGPNFPMSWFLAEATKWAPAPPVQVQKAKKILRLNNAGFANPPLVRWDGEMDHGERLTTWIKSIAQAQALLDLGYVQENYGFSVRFKGEGPK